MVVDCPLSIATVGGAPGTSAKLVGTSVRLVGLRIWNERGARQNECETRCWLTSERVRNSLLESFRSRRFSLVAGRDAKVTNWTDPLTLNPWFWRAIRLDHSGRCSASFATAGECSDESECCTWSSVGQSAKHCTRSCRIAWSNHDRAESFTSTDEKDACGSERLRKAASVLRQRRRLLRVGQEGREPRVCCVFPNVRGVLAFAAESQDAVTAATVAIGVPELEVETSAEIDGQLFVVLSALTEGESFDIVMSAEGDHGFESWRKLHGR